jgi:hypothetical protein
VRFACPRSGREVDGAEALFIFDGLDGERRAVEPHDEQLTLRGDRSQGWVRSGDGFAELAVARGARASGQGRVNVRDLHGAGAVGHDHDPVGLDGLVLTLEAGAEEENGDKEHEQGAHRGEREAGSLACVEFPVGPSGEE